MSWGRKSSLSGGSSTPRVSTAPRTAAGASSNMATAGRGAPNHPVINEKPRFIHDGVLYSYEGNVFDKLQDPSLFTGSHRNRFDEYGRGKGILGRDSTSLKAGFQGGENRTGDRWQRGLRDQFYHRKEGTATGGPNSTSWMVENHRSVSQASGPRSTSIGARNRSASQLRREYQQDPNHDPLPRFEAWALNEAGDLELDENRTYQMNYGGDSNLATTRGPSTRSSVVIRDGQGQSNAQWQDMMGGSAGSSLSQASAQVGSAADPVQQQAPQLSRLGQPYQPIVAHGSAQQPISSHDRLQPPGQQASNHAENLQALNQDGGGFKFQSPGRSLVEDRPTSQNMKKKRDERKLTEERLEESVDTLGSARRHREARRENEMRQRPGGVGSDHYRDAEVGRSSDDDMVALLQHSEGRRALEGWEKQALLNINQAPASASTGAHRVAAPNQPPSSSVSSVRGGSQVGGRGGFWMDHAPSADEVASLVDQYQQHNSNSQQHPGARSPTPPSMQHHTSAQEPRYWADAK